MPLFKCIKMMDLWWNIQKEKHILRPNSVNVSLGFFLPLQRYQCPPNLNSPPQKWTHAGRMLPPSQQQIISVFLLSRRGHSQHTDTNWFGNPGSLSNEKHCYHLIRLRSRKTSWEETHPESTLRLLPSAQHVSDKLLRVYVDAAGPGRREIHLNSETLESVDIFCKHVKEDSGGA